MKSLQTRTSRRIFSVLCALALASLAGQGMADNYPSKAIHVISPSPPGGGTDTLEVVFAGSHTVGTRFTLPTGFERLGITTETGRLVLKQFGQVVCDIPVAPLGDDAPNYDRPYEETEKQDMLGPDAFTAPESNADALRELGDWVEATDKVRAAASRLHSFGGSPIGNSRVKLTNVADCVARGLVEPGQDPRAVLAAWITSLQPGNIVVLVGSAFALAASSLFGVKSCRSMDSEMSITKRMSIPSVNCSTRSLLLCGLAKAITMKIKARKKNPVGISLR